MMTSGSTFVHVETFPDYIEANIIAGRLQSEGINCWLKDENTVTINPVWTTAVGGIKLMVAQVQAERAIELLKEYRKEKKTIIKCARCGSDNVELVTTPRKATNWFWTFFGALFTDYSIAGDKVYHCFSCSHEFPMEDKE